MFRFLKETDVRDKKVLVRCDFNVPLSEKGEIEDDFRISQTLPTINYLISKKAKVILISHLGNPKGKITEGLRLTPIQKRLSELLGFFVEKTLDCLGREVEEKVKKMKGGEVLLLENVRFHKEEEENDLNFAKSLSKLGDLFINDAFGVCHRSHASVVGIPQYLPSFAGFLLEKEIRELSSVLEKPKRPFVVIIGGSKIESKIRIIDRFLEIADHLLLGGKIANSVLAIKNICQQKYLPPPEIIEKIKKINLTSPKLHLPVDVIVENKMGIYPLAPGKTEKEDDIFDIGPETIKIFSKIIKEAKTIIWAGPLGFFEKHPFERGTKEVGKAVIETSAFKIAGGGDTLSALLKLGLRDKFNHISTGGGAMLKFLSGEELPGLKALGF